MLEPLRTLLLAAAGTLDLTEEKLRSVVDELVRRSQLAADEAGDLRALWTAEAAKRRSRDDERIRAAVEEALGRYNVASHASVVNLDARLSLVEQVVGRLAPPSPAP